MLLMRSLRGVLSASQQGAQKCSVLRFRPPQLHFVVLLSIDDLVVKFPDCDLALGLGLLVARGLCASKEAGLFGAHAVADAEQQGEDAAPVVFAIVAGAERAEAAAGAGVRIALVRFLGRDRRDESDQWARIGELVPVLGGVVH